MQADINVIISLDMRRAAVCVELFQTMLQDDPVLAETWRDLHRNYMTARFPHRMRVLTPLDLVGNSVELLLSHPRYGYVARWLDGWREMSMSMREDLCREHGLTTHELDAILNAELARRRGEEVPGEFA